ncbi:DUF418 domain-containing protein [Coralloluteibacterium thermophilus]|uniref:DUF418 domain-containing protein n=1 Tax=Coralloluteibacterium thermophilum TaxID=2707049 RepID=A0ABV9NML8_9GAMM
MTAAADGAPRGRIELLDALRGVALLGIFLMNVEWFSRPMQELGMGPPADAAGLDALLGWGIFAVVQGKFWVLFSLLFGMSFAAMEAAAPARGFVPTMLRRLGMLAALGVAHALLLWPGDILLAYAVAGLGLLLFRGIDARVLAGLGIAVYMAMALLGLLGSLMMVGMPEQMADTLDGLAADRAAGVVRGEVYATGGYAAVTAARWQDFVAVTLAGLGNSASTLGVFLVGVWFFRSGVVADPAAHRRTLGWIAVLGLMVGVPLVWAATARAMALEAGDIGGQYLALSIMLLGNLPVALAYLALLALGLSAPLARGLRSALAPAGRMALTNYLMQSLVASLVFYGYGLGQWGQMGRTGQCALVLVVFAAQLALSRWWLARFAYGPVEWLWRAFARQAWPRWRAGAAG